MQTSRNTDRPNTAPLLLVLLVFAAFLPVFKAGWIWDDDRYLTGNLALRSLNGLWRIWTDFRTEPQYYPLLHTSLWVQFKAFGLFPIGYHAVNVILHTMNAGLLFLALDALGIPGAALAAALFAVHPVQVETVGWITEQKNLLSTFFVLLSLHAWLHVGITAATLLFVCALLSKSTAAVLPAVLLVIVWWRRGRLERRDVRPLYPMFLLAALMGTLTAALERIAGAEGGDWSFSLAERFLIAGRALWFYAGKLVWPASLAFIYPKWTLDASSAFQWLFPLTAAAVLITLYVKQDRLGRGPAAAAFLFAGILFPVLGFLNVFPMRYSFVADHFQYFACIPLFVLFSAGLVKAEEALKSEPGMKKFLPLWGRCRGAAVGVTMLVLVVLTFRRSLVFENSLTLWQDTIEKNPGSWMVHYNLGKAYAGLGDWGKAEELFRSANALKPEDSGIHNNLGNLLYGQGKLEEGLEEFRLAVRYDPGSPQAHNNVGVVLGKLGRTPEAVQEYHTAVQLRPGFAAAWFNLGEALAELGDYENAEKCLVRTLQLQPDLKDAELDLAEVRARLSRRKPL